MGKIDYAFKAQVLREHSDLLVKYKKARLVDYQVSSAVDTLEQTGELLPILLMEDSEVNGTTNLKRESEILGLAKEYKEVGKIYQAGTKRTKRLQERVRSMLLSGACIFLTFTFDDDTLRNTNEVTRRKYVSRYLKQYNCAYLANIDFGKENHREHYHAIIATDRVDYSLWTFGAINGEKIRNRDISTDSKKLAKYVCKLTNHAIKETTKRSCLIYSR